MTLSHLESDASSARRIADLALLDLAAENSKLRFENAQLVDLVADLAWDNWLVGAVADYRCRHSPDLLDVLAGAARTGLKRAA